MEPTKNNKTYNAEYHPVVGIDLGTTFSAIASWTGSSARTYSPKGNHTFQSVVYFDNTCQQFIYDNIAFKSGIINPENMVFGVKRLMDDKKAVINLGERKFSPIDISAMILQYIYSSVKEMYPQDLYVASGAVVTVPYYFKAHQCENTAEAARKAGLNLIGIIQEPIAAALAYGLHLCTEDKVRDENILVFDLGGGTFDITIFKLKDNGKSIIFEVLGIGGDDRLGGMDFDKALMDYVIEKEDINFDAEANEKVRKQGKQALLTSVIQLKETLSYTDNYYLTVGNVITGVNIDRTYYRDEFEEVISLYLDKIRGIIQSTMIAAGITADQIDKVIKVGGSSKIPAIDKILGEVIGKNKVYGDIDPSLCVAQGAAIYAAYLTGNLNFNKEIGFKTVTAHGLGVEDALGRFVILIPPNKKTPAKKTQIFYTDQDYVTEVEVKVYQGTSRMAKFNSHVGTILVKGLKPALRKKLPISITFEVEEDQMVIVTVIQEESGINMREVLKLF